MPSAFRGPDLLRGQEPAPSLRLPLGLSSECHSHKELP